MTRIAVLDDYLSLSQKVADWSPLGGRAEITVFTEPLAGEDQAAERLAGFEVIVGMRERTPFPGSLLNRLPGLKLLITTGMRNASFDLDAARALGITVCGTRLVGNPAGEFAVGMMIALMRDIPGHFNSMQQGQWRPSPGRDLAGKALGLLGLGKIGGFMATVGRAFQMEVIAWSQNLTEERATACGARLVSKNDLFRLSDVVSIHLALGDRTRGLVGADELRLMKPTAYLINTARGPIVDEAALVTVLEEKRIAGAAIDVYGVEPLPANHPLRGLDNVLLTPHLGYATLENHARAYQDAVEDILAFLDGKPVRVLV